MSRILTYGGLLQFRDNKVQVIPSGSVAADCVCCGGGGSCSFCDQPGQGGPFSRIDVSTTVTGFVSSHHAFTKAICVPTTSGTHTYVYKASNLDAANGTYNYSTTASPDCLSGSLTVSLATASVVFEYWFRPPFTFPAPDCADGTLQSTFTWTDIRLSVSHSEILLFCQDQTGQPSCKPFWRARDTSGTSNLCTSASGTQSATFVTVPGPFFTIGPCPTFSSFSYGFTTTITGVP